MSNTSTKVREITLTAILAAIILLMAFTPLGYLRVGPVSITFLVIPVVIGGMTLGPVRGGFLGAVFGATSFAQCFMGDPFGAALMALSPLATAAACFIPRVLIGVVAGLLFPALLLYLELVLHIHMKMSLAYLPVYLLFSLAGGFFLSALARPWRRLGNSLTAKILAFFISLLFVVEMIAKTILQTYYGPSAPTLAAVPSGQSSSASSR